MYEECYICSGSGAARVGRPGGACPRLGPGQSRLPDALRVDEGLLLQAQLPDTCGQADGAVVRTGRPFTNMLA